MFVLLDIDGTLVDTNYLHVDAWARSLHELGVVVPRAVIHRHIGKGADQFLPMFVKSQRERARAAKLHLELYAEFEAFGFPLPGALELLHALSSDGHALWLATSGTPKEIDGRLENLGLMRSHFDGIVSSKDVKRSKPYPDIFKEVLRQAKAKPSEAVVIGDTRWDMEAARSARIRGIGLLSGGASSAAQLKAAGAEAVFEDCEAFRTTGLTRLWR